jgi:maltooligosyltrehalose trehalohydrolase
MRARIPDPTDEKVFQACRLDQLEGEVHREALALHRDLLRLRREDAVFKAQGNIDGATLDEDVFVLRFFAGDGRDDRLLFVSLGTDKYLSPIPEPLLAPPPGAQWSVVWSSEDPRYGGGGALPVETIESWFIPGKAAFALAPKTQ